MKSISDLFKIISIGLFLIFSKEQAAQNLIPNPSFEEANTCEYYDVTCSKKGWRNQYGTAIRYIKSKEGLKARTGKYTAHLRMYHQVIGEDRRPYLQVPLICPLRKNEKYKVTLYVKPNFLSVTQLGLYFSENLRCSFKEPMIPLRDSRDLLKFEPQITFVDEAGLYSREPRDASGEKQWLKLEKIYTANGNERVLFIGSFQRKKDIRTIPVPKDSVKYLSVYLIDDLSLVPLDTNSISNCCYEENLKLILEDGRRHSCPDTLTNYWKDCGFAESPTIKVGQPFVMGNINFESNKDVLLPEAYADLDSLVIYLNNNPYYQLEINGHTDSVGSSQYNIDLSKDRANAVKQYLVSQGIEPGRLTAKGFGYAKPIAGNDTPKGRKKNRRVEFLIIRE